MAQDPLHLQWHDARWPPDALAGGAVMEYFGQPESNPFFERDSVNQRIRQQLGRYDDEAIRWGGGGWGGRRVERHGKR